MSCAWCNHWIRDDGIVAKAFGDESGKCILNPVHVRTEEFHICAKFQFNTNTYLGHSPMSALLKRSEEGWGLYQKERDERIRLEKVAKELRAKLKAARSAAEAPTSAEGVDND
jgi:hypothetical protein